MSVEIHANLNKTRINDTTVEHRTKEGKSHRKKEESI